MATHGWCGCVRGCRRVTGQRMFARRTPLVAVVALLPALAACSSFFSSPSSSPSSSNAAADQSSSAASYRPPATAAPTSQTSPPPNSSTANATPPASSAQSEGAFAGVYPSVSLVDYFKGSTDSSPSTQTAAVPHPPSTYTPAGEPYTPASGQPGEGGASGLPAPQAAGVGAAQPANSDAAASAMPYPQESLWDIFKKSDAQ